MVESCKGGQKGRSPGVIFMFTSPVAAAGGRGCSGGGGGDGGDILSFAWGGVVLTRWSVFQTKHADTILGFFGCS